MKTVNTSKIVKVPAGGMFCFRWRPYILIFFVVSVDIKARKVTIKGPRGVLVKDFGHVDIEIIPANNQIKIQVWFGLRKHIACIRTVATHIENMIKGVTKVLAINF